jgi:tetratricopeptide (TPR) repeat protein
MHVNSDLQPTTFISYARENELFTRQLYNDLTAAGVRPWLDRYDIPPGAIWDDEIQRGLNQVSHVLVVVSAASVASQNVHDEWNYAISLNKTIIPLIHEQLDPPQIPYRLHGYNWVVFSGKDYVEALKQLLTVLPVTAPANPLAAPEPAAPVTIPAGKIDLVAAAAAWKHGNAEFHDGNLQAAMNAYTDAIRLAPQQPEAYIHRGMVLYYLERYQDALKDFIRAQKLNPDIPLLYNNRGVTYLALKNVALALADFAEATQLNPVYANAYYNRAQTYMVLRRFRLALNDYNRAIEINNRVPLFYSSRGLVYAEQGLYEQAIADYNQAITLDKNHISAYGNRANAYANMGRTDDALADYDRVIDLDPEHYLAYAGRSEIKFCAGDYTQAALDASTVIGLQPRFHGGYALRALADFRRGKRDDAFKQYAKAIELDTAWRTPEGAAAYLTICPEQALQTVRDILTGLRQ